MSSHRQSYNAELRLISRRPKRERKTTTPPKAPELKKVWRPQLAYVGASRGDPLIILFHEDLGIDFGLQ